MSSPFCSAGGGGCQLTSSSLGVRASRVRFSGGDVGTAERGGRGGGGGGGGGTGLEMLGVSSPYYKMWSLHHIAYVEIMVLLIDNMLAPS